MTTYTQQIHDLIEFITIYDGGYYPLNLNINAVDQAVPKFCVVPTGGKGNVTKTYRTKHFQIQCMASSEENLSIMMNAIMKIQSPSSVSVTIDPDTSEAGSYAFNSGGDGASSNYSSWTLKLNSQPVTFYDYISFIRFSGIDYSHLVSATLRFTPSSTYLNPVNMTIYVLSAPTSTIGITNSSEIAQVAGSSGAFQVATWESGTEISLNTADSDDDILELLTDDTIVFEIAGGAAGTDDLSANTNSIHLDLTYSIAGSGYPYFLEMSNPQEGEENGNFIGILDCEARWTL
jgi:hypothetical protein